MAKIRASRSPVQPMRVKVVVTRDEKRDDMLLASVLFAAFRISLQR